MQPRDLGLRFLYRCVAKQQVRDFEDHHLPMILIIKAPSLGDPSPDQAPEIRQGETPAQADDKAGTGSVSGAGTQSPDQEEHRMNGRKVWWKSSNPLAPSPFMMSGMTPSWAGH
jgi:hypothetical protein